VSDFEIEVRRGAALFSRTDTLFGRSKKYLGGIVPAEVIKVIEN
jgi:hypothetical protein